MIIIEIAQGHYRDLTGIPRASALKTFAEQDAAFLQEHPGCVTYHRPCWSEIDVPDTATARWGTEWYTVDEAGLLKRHSAQYDSSG